jgi:cation diffusion facilitator family transporter
VSVSSHGEFPPDRAEILRKAKRLEWITIVYLITAVVVIYLTLGSSQAMKAAWYEDLLSLVPPIAFLIGTRIRAKQPNDDFPYGYHRAITISYLCASLALFVMGLFILYDSLLKLMLFEHPPIGLVQPFGEPIWLGWLMIPALVYSGVPAVILGRMKLPLARQLHDKVLFADAKMNKADWLTAMAAIVGVIGVGLGFWWTDAVAASLISLDITHDGFTNLRMSLADLMDNRPTTVDGEQADPIVQRVETELLGLDWIKAARVRLREDGHVFFGEALVVPTSQTDLADRLQEAAERVQKLDWRLHDLVISPVSTLDHETRSGE